jgi:hypothetical protein
MSDVMMKALQIQVESLTRQVESLGPENERVRKLLTEFDQRHDADQARIRELEAELAALREARGVRVKPLEWYSLGAEWKASTGFGPYMVAPYDSVEWACWTPNQDIDDEPGHGLHGSEEEAKQYAQDHFRAATASALEPAPVTPAEAWQPIETAPKDELIDIWLKDGVRWADCYYDRICGEWRTSRPSGKLLRIREQHVSHWMPSPTPPRALADAGEAG